MWKRRRGTAIVETSKGILVASGRRKIYLLPGGGADKGESRRKAATRELREETGLKAYSTHFLFKMDGSRHKAHGGGHFFDKHKVFLVKAHGTPRPHHEIKHIRWYKPGSKINISGITRKILHEYYKSVEENEKKHLTDMVICYIF